MHLYKNNLNLYLILIFFISLFLSFSIYKDFGISIDEESTRKHGLVSLNYILSILNENFGFNYVIESNLPSLNNYEYKEYGVFFELLSLAAEKIFNVNKYANIFFLKHLITHIFLIFAIYSLFQIILKSTNNLYLSFWSALTLYTSPRIFAQSFYNNKDIIFMSLLIISIYFIFEFFKTKNNKNLFFSCLFLALLTATRVIGFYFFIIFLIFLILEIIENKKNHANFKIFLKVIISYFLFTYFFWPLLWSEPLNNFIFSLRSMSDYNWNGFVFYLGKFHHSSFLPWHYIPIWIFASTSLLLVILIFASIIFTVIRFISRIIKISNKNNNFQIWKNHKEYLLYFNLVLVLVPSFAIILNKSTLYTGWRHLYFIYPSLILICSVFLFYLLKYFKKSKIFKISIYSFCALILINNSYNLIKLHPYQNIYFNSFFEKKANEYFEIDYWGLSNKEALKKIAITNEDSKICNVGLMDLHMSKKMLSSKNQSKINIFGEQFEKCNFIITSSYFVFNPKYTKKYQIPSNFKVIDNIKRGNIVISTTYKKN